MFIIDVSSGWGDLICFFAIERKVIRNGLNLIMLVISVKMRVEITICI